MPYKLIALDMDDTVLGSDKNISPRTMSAIKQAIAQGHIVAIATGRPIVALDRYTDLLELVDTPIITYNGAKVVHTRDHRVLYQENLDKQTALEVFTRGKAYGVAQFVWSNDRLYQFEENEQTERYTSRAHVKPILSADIGPLAEEGITKILWVDSAPAIEEYQQALAGTLTGDVTFCTSSPLFLEFFSSKVSKGLTLKFLGEYHGIAQSEIIAVGDQDNDIPMLQYAGLGVAMGNALEEVKAVADFVTLTNDEDGVAHVIEKFMLTP